MNALSGESSLLTMVKKSFPELLKSQVQGVLGALAHEPTMKHKLKRKEAIFTTTNVDLLQLNTFRHLMQPCSQYRQLLPPDDKRDRQHHLKQIRLPHWF